MPAEQSIDATISQLEQEAAELLSLSGHCAQTTFSVLNDHFELEGGTTLKALTPLPGLALRGEVCGAVIGGLMALGLVYGRDDLTDLAAFRRSLPPARSFCRLFQARYDSINCGDILEKEMGARYDLSKRQDFLDYINCGGLETCSAVVKTGVRLVAEQLLEEQKSEPDEPGVMLTV